MSATTESPKTFTSKFVLDSMKTSDVPRFIGKRALTIKKNVKVPAWKMFTAWQKKEKIQDETKHTLFVKISGNDETNTVSCEVNSTSEELHKFATFSVKKAANEFNTRVFHHTFYASMDHHLIPLFIGQKGKSIQTFLKRAVSEYEDGDCPFQAGNPFSQENRIIGDLRLSVEPLDYCKEDEDIEEAAQKMMDEVEKSKFIDFVGWQPSTEEYEPFIKISISVFTTLEKLNDIKEYLPSKLNDYIGFIEKKDEKRSFHREKILEDIDQALDS